MRTFRKDLPRIVKKPQYTQFYRDLMVRQKFRRTLKYQTCILILGIQERKELESSVKFAIRQIKLWTNVSRKLIPSQGNLAEFEYGLVCGMVIGSFTERFIGKNGRQPDRDELADLFLVIRNQMPAVRKAVINELESD
jgi:hypothetical protein